MKKSVWGPYIWTFLHCLTIRIKPEHFQSEKNVLISYIERICDNLPCPSCAMHAIQTLKKLKLKNVKKKDDLIECIYKMHNEVNIRLKKPIFDKSKLHETYKSYNLQTLMINYFKLNNHVKYAEKMMVYSSRRKIFLKEFLDYCKNNTHKFDLII